ncbi:unnamed protein product [Brassica oleracea]|uniref:(rape) hypothetical protein n=1 Tax=Brassica napus TaxID=3708 RepID=A0A816JGS4_BRANA|nr:unnamed protein product [Brassica napus]
MEVKKEGPKELENPNQSSKIPERLMNLEKLDICTQTGAESLHAMQDFGKVKSNATGFGLVQLLMFQIFFPFQEIWLNLDFRLSFLEKGDILVMLKRLSSSVPSTAERANKRRRLDSSNSKSDSSSDQHDESEHDLLAPSPLSYAPQIPPLVGPALMVGDDDLTEWRKKYSVSSFVVLRALGSSEHASSGMPEEITV